MRRRRAVAALTAAVVAAGGLGYAVADAYDQVPGVLTVRPVPTPPPPFAPAPGARATTSVSPVLPVAGSAVAAPSAEAVTALLAPLLTDDTLGPAVGAVVADARTGAVLLEAEPAAAREPASVVKLLTGAAALSRLGPGRTLPTRAVVGGQPGQVVLVGGGDVLLAAGQGAEGAARGAAGLADLADATARALVERRGPGQGQPSVVLTVDDTLFGDERMGAGWTTSDVAAGFVAPVTALAVDAGRTGPQNYAPRVPDPALAAGEVFADLLRARGVPVAPRIDRGGAPGGAEVLGEVRSAPVEDVVAYMLSASDNNTAEALARLVALDAGRPPTFAGSADAVLEEVAALGVDVTGARLADGSGLSDGSALPPRVLTDLLVAAAAADRPELRPLLTGLPVAGLQGTLGKRFTTPGTAAGVGSVRAKTGSLTGVTSLAGTVMDAEGRLLAFAVLADRVPATGAARRTLDAVAAALATCGCR